MKPTRARKVLAELRKGFHFLASTPNAGHGRTDLTDEPVKFWPVYSFLIVYDPATTLPLWIVRVVYGKQNLERVFRDEYHAHDLKRTSSHFNFLTMHYAKLRFHHLVKFESSDLLTLVELCGW